jgi:DNA-binding CsgD family transcriptional regulator
MLAMLERYGPKIRAARSDPDIRVVLADLAADLGYRSAYLVEYKSGLSGVEQTIDTDPNRGPWWEEYFSSRMHLADPHVDARLLVEGAIHLDASRFKDRPEGFAAFAAKYDLVNGILVPIVSSGQVVGAVGLVGERTLTLVQERGLMLVAYALYSQRRSFQQRKGDAAPYLTDREREVMNLSAEGLTSEQVAQRLGIAARTVNQHIDNVADKLGTRNRTHTVAEAIRNNLLN